MDAKELKRPKDEDYRQQLSGTLEYLFALEKYCDQLEHKLNSVEEGKEPWSAAPKEGEKVTKVIFPKID